MANESRDEYVHAYKERQGRLDADAIEFWIWLRGKLERMTPYKLFLLVVVAVLAGVALGVMFALTIIENKPLWLAVALIVAVSAFFILRNAWIGKH